MAILFKEFSDRRQEIAENHGNPGLPGSRNFPDDVERGRRVRQLKAATRAKRCPSGRYFKNLFEKIGLGFTSGN